MKPEEFFKSNLKLIEDVIKIICRRHNLDIDAEEDFASHVKLQLIENDYDKIKKFQGRSHFRTYLITVISRLFIDYIIKNEKKWRPSEKAKELGDIAITLEKMLFYHNMSFEDAFETITNNHGISITREDAHSIAAQLKQRTPALTKNVGDKLLSAIPHHETLPDEELVRKEAYEIKKKLVAIIDGIKLSLSADDCIILKMMFEDGFNLSAIGRALNISRSQIERRVKWILKTFKEGILSKGLSISDVTDIINE